MTDELKAELTRRQFFCALVASAVAAGVPLPKLQRTHVIDAADVVWAASGGNIKFTAVVVYNELSA